MSNEIKIDTKVIDEVLADLRTTIESLESSLGKEIEGENNMDIVDTFNEIKQEYEDLLIQYKSFFIRNIEVTEKSIASMKETEQWIANTISSFIKDGLGKLSK